VTFVEADRFRRGEPVQNVSHETATLVEALELATH
jgi:hypothetical protein